MNNVILLDALRGIARKCPFGWPVLGAMNISPDPPFEELAWRACSLFVLEKGKPIVRSGRKAVGRDGQPSRKLGCRRDERSSTVSRDMRGGHESLRATGWCVSTAGWLSEKSGNGVSE